MSLIALRRHAPTSNEKGAMKGTTGRPSEVNPFVTHRDPRNRDARTPTAHVSTHGPGGSDVLNVLPLLTEDPPDTSPSTDAVWFLRDGGSPETISLRVRKDGVVTTFALGEMA